MTSFIRIKNYFFNLDRLAFVRIEKNHIDFGFAFMFDSSQGQNFIRLEKGKDLDDSEYEQLREFIVQLPDPDRVVII
jgi:hypothetical protein